MPSPSAGLPFPEILGSDERVRQCVELAARAGRKGARLLIQGETGTGKELVAKVYHLSSSFGAGPFRNVNCGALDRALARSELFGHEAGAFTGALEKREGAFGLTQGGTLFLDEIGDTPRDVQVDLLDVIERREYTPLGASSPVPRNGLLVFATNRDLQLLVDRGEFRSDLFCRLNVVRVTLPPLRERGSDILILAYAFLREYAPEGVSLSLGALQAFQEYGWPGNVRELKNEIERLAVVVDRGEIGPELLSPRIVEAWNRSSAQDLDLRRMSAGDKRALAEARLQASEGRVKQASRSLNTTPYDFRRMCKRVKLDWKSPR